MDIGLRFFDGSRAKEGSIYGISLVETDSFNALPIRIATNEGVKAIGTLGYYELNYLGRQYSSYGAVDWHDLISNGEVTDTDTYVIYSTSQGNWVPSPTKTEELRLNVVGERNVGGGDPRCGFKVLYRVYSNLTVSIQSKTWGNHGDVKLDRLDTFRRVSETSFLVNGSPLIVESGTYYELERFDWNPGDHGNGYSWLRLHNDATSYFDIEVLVWEYDEEHDSAYARIDTYIEPVE